MKNTGDALIDRTSGLIVLISSIVMIALMVTGGCEGNGRQTPLPRRQGSLRNATVLSMSISAVPPTSLAGSTCLPYVCDIVDDTEEPA